MQPAGPNDIQRGDTLLVGDLPVIEPAPGGIPPVIVDVRPEEVAPPPIHPLHPVRRKPRLNGTQAVIVLLVFLGAQLAGGLAVGMAGGVVAGLKLAIHHSGVPLAQEIAALRPALMLWGMLVGGLVSAIAMLKFCVVRVRDSLSDRSPNGAAWVYGTARENAKGLVVGVLIGLSGLVVAAIADAIGIHATPSPMAEIYSKPGAPQLVWVALALFLAPPTEELLFRGVMYGGFRASVGARWAAILTIAIFVLLHVTELVHFPPATIGLAGLAGGALWIRLRTAAIGPAVLVHFGYNLVATSTVVLMTATR